MNKIVDHLTTQALYRLALLYPYEAVHFFMLIYTCVDVLHCKL